VNDVPDTVGATNIIILTTFEGRKVRSLVVKAKIVPWSAFAAHERFPSFPQQIKFRAESAEQKADWLAAFCRPATSR
jgi:hypothetical protein